MSLSRRKKPRHSVGKRRASEAPSPAASHLVAPTWWAIWRTLPSRWHALSSLHRHWLINIILGVAIETMLIAGHHYHWGFVTRFTNTGLDVMTRLSQSTCALAEAWQADGPQAPPTPVARWLRCPSAGSAQSVPLLVEVDERTWRSPLWGGGEPAIAPRDGLAALVGNAFRLGAQRVVLDVQVQDSQPLLAGLSDGSSPKVSNTDEAFATQLRNLLREPYFAADKLLVLVRTERAPLLDAINRGAAYHDAFLPELRQSTAVDRVVAESGGRIALAAPYFTVDPGDRLTRDWVLFKTLCKANVQSPTGGWLHFVPSVQLLTAAHALGVSSAVVAPEPGAGALRGTCHPFPLDAEPTSVDVKSAVLASGLRAQLYGSDDGESSTGLVDAYWALVRDAFNKKLPPGQALAPLPAAHSLGNRILYRYRYDDVVYSDPDASLVDTTGYVHRRPAHELLVAAASNGANDDGMRSIFAGRTVVIGQTFREAGDIFYTPVGVMPGAAVLVNAIDSMRVYQLLRPTAGATAVAIALVLIVIVGYLFARWDSTRGTVLATAAVLLSVGVASFFMFQHGVWLDVAAPILGIQLHRIWAAWEERRELMRRRAVAGVAH